MSVYAAFVLVISVSGDPVMAAEGVDRFQTLEACEAWNAEHAQATADRLTESGIPFDSVKAKCAVDTGQEPHEVFGLKKPGSPT